MYQLYRVVGFSFRTMRNSEFPVDNTCMMVINYLCGDTTATLFVYMHLQRNLQVQVTIET